MIPILFGSSLVSGEVHAWHKFFPATYDMGLQVTSGQVIRYSSSASLDADGNLSLSGTVSQLTSTSSASSLNPLRGKWFQFASGGYIYYADTDAQIWTGPPYYLPAIMAYPIGEAISEGYVTVTDPNRDAYPDGYDVASHPSNWYVYVGSVPRVEDFSTNGIGSLAEATKCIAHEALNGEDEIELVYPITGKHYDNIIQRNIILAKPNPADDPQPFRIYRISKPLNGLITVNARHIAYDLSGAVTKPYSASNAAAALSGLTAHSIGVDPFTFWTDLTTVANFSLISPRALRSVLGGSEGSILDTFGGEYKWDKTVVRLYSHRGADRGVSILYGKNLMNLTQEENCSSCYTAVFPFWLGSEGALVAPDDPVPVSGTFDYQRILTLDLSTDFEEPPTVDQLTQAAQRYITNNRIGVPKVSLDVSFIQLEQTEEYKDHPWAERVLLGDTVEVVFERLGVNAKAKVVDVTYNVLQDKYESAVIGDTRANIADTVAQQQVDIREAPKKAVSFLDAAIAAATQLITGNMGGHIVLHLDPSTGKPYELLIMDTEDIDTAVKVWRFNLSGLGYSSTGYNGPYTTAITMNGQIVADFVKTGSLAASVVTAANIVAGFIRNSSGTFDIDLDNGTLTISGGKKTFTRSSYVTGDDQKVARYLVGSGTLTDEELIKFDTDGTGTITITDVAQIASILAGTRTVNMESSWTITISPSDGMKMVRHYKDLARGVSKDILALSLSNGVVHTQQVNTNGLSASTVISNSGAFNSLTKGGSNVLTADDDVVTQMRIGTFVYGLPYGDSTNACTFVPIGTSGTFQLGSGASYIRFTINSSGNITSGNVTAVPVWNDGP